VVGIDHGEFGAILDTIARKLAARPGETRLDRPHAVPRPDSARVGAQFGQAPYHDLTLEGR
jgi:hypothetical protein